MRKAIKIRFRKDAGTGDTIKDIIEAAMEGNAPLVREVLKQGADINTIEPNRGFTCLHIACLNGDEDVVDVLLEHHRQYGDLDFSIKTLNPPRYAWQLAMSAHHYDIGNKVDEAARSNGGNKPSGPKLVK